MRLSAENVVEQLILKVIDFMKKIRFRHQRKIGGKMVKIFGKIVLKNCMLWPYYKTITIVNDDNK
jgi:hypothetical protein